LGEVANLWLTYGGLGLSMTVLSTNNNFLQFFISKPALILQMKRNN